MERYLTIIGETGAVIRDGNPDIYNELHDLRYAIGLPNRLSHDYGKAISEDPIWEAVTVSIPNLLLAISNLDETR